MDKLPINPLDLVVLAVLFLSALLAFSRGFTREILTFFAWTGAGAAAWFAFPYAQPMAQQYAQSKVIADALAISGSFFVALLILSVISHSLSGKVKESRLSAVDRSLGFAFGVLRGAVLVSLAYLFFTWLWPTDGEKPSWLREAKSAPMLARGAQLIYELIPDPRTDEATRDLQRTKAREDRIKAERAALDRLSNPAPAGTDQGAPTSNPGYKAPEQQKSESKTGTSGSAKTPPELDRNE